MLNVCRSLILIILSAFVFSGCRIGGSLLGEVSGCGDTCATIVPADLDYPGVALAYLVGEEFELSPSAGTGDYLTYTVSPDLPAGLSIDSSTGVISGVPTEDMTRTWFTITSTNHLGSSTTDFQTEFVSGYRVNTFNDTNDDNNGDGLCEDTNGDCSLRAALEEVEATGNRYIALLPNGEYNTTSRIRITTNTKVIAENFLGAIIRGAGAHKIFTVDDGAVVRFTGFFIYDGSDDFGGLIRVGQGGAGGSLYLEGVSLNDGSSTGGNGFGGCLYIDTNSSVTLQTSGFANCDADQSGGSVYVSNSGTLLSYDSQFLLGSAGVDGGGVFFGGSTLTVERNLFWGSVATGNGGLLAIDSAGATVSVESTTFHMGTAASGGNIFSSNPDSWYFKNATITGGVATSASGGGNICSNITLRNSIMYGSTNDDCGSGANCAGRTVTTLGNNIDGDNSCSLNVGLNDQPSTDPILGPMQANGGTTVNRMPLGGSPAIDTGTNVDCPDSDQRLRVRPVNGTCDIGAIEVQDDD